MGEMDCLGGEIKYLRQLNLVRHHWHRRSERQLRTRLEEGPTGLPAAPEAPGPDERRRDTRMRLVVLGRKQREPIAAMALRDPHLPPCVGVVHLDAISLSEAAEPAVVGGAEVRWRGARAASGHDFILRDRRLREPLDEQRLLFSVDSEHFGWRPRAALPRHERGDFDGHPPVESVDACLVVLRCLSGGGC